MKNLPIGKKLLITFGTILLLFATAIIVVIVSQTQLKSSYTYFSEKVFANSNKALHMRRDIQASAKAIMYAITTDDVEETQKFVEQAAESLTTLEEGYVYLKENSKVDPSILENFYNNMISSVQFKEQLFELLKQNKNDEALKSYYANYYPVLIKANEYLLQISDFTDKVAAETYRDAIEQINITFAVILVLSAITVISTVWLGLYITRSIKSPLVEIEKAARSLSKGNLSGVLIEYESKDELGNLAASMRTTVSGLASIVTDIGFLMKEMSGGNFNVKTKHAEGYVGEFEPVLIAMRTMNDSLSSTISQIKDSSSQVEEGSEQMSQSAQNLAEGSTEQAGAVEELLATISNISEGLEQTSEKVSHSHLQSTDNAKRANESRDEMKIMINTMERISDTSKQIGSIISEIEEIASQTNLLSLNASIEAARAGEAGKGFAVVANQIGKLADESAQSAVRTRELIENSIKQVDEGVQAVSKTANAIDEVVNGMEDIAQATKVVAELSKEQSEAMKQAEAGVHQISQVIQTNSATAEETSATSEELSAQAVNMNELVSRFILKR